MAQRTWLNFTDLQTANAKLFGYTRAALSVIEDNLPVREQVFFIATAEVTDMFGDVYDGVLVLTDNALYIGHADSSTNQAYASWVDCNDHNALDRLRDRGNKALYRTNGFSGQNIAISVDSAYQLEHLLFGPPPAPEPPPPPPAPEPPPPPPAPEPPPPPPAPEPPPPPPAPEPPPPPPAPEPPSDEPMWIGVKTKEKFIKKAMPLIEMNLRPGESLLGLAEATTEILAITNRRAFTMKTYGNPIPLVSLMREEMRDVSFEGSGTKIIVKTSANDTVQLCKTYTKEDVPRILELIRGLIPHVSAPPPTSASPVQDVPPSEIIYFGKFKDKELDQAKTFLDSSLLPGEHVIAMLNSITRWTALTNQRVLVFKVVAPKKFEDAVALDQIVKVTALDKLSGSVPILETRAGMQVELNKSAQREDVYALCNEIRKRTLP